MPAKKRKIGKGQKPRNTPVRPRSQNAKMRSRKRSVAAAEQVVPSVCRGELARIIASIQDPEFNGTVTCNAVEVLELLLDAGQYGVCIALSTKVAEMLSDPGQRLLFRSYKIFANMIVHGEVAAAIKVLARQKALLEGSGCSSEDCIRGSVLLARAKIHGVAVGCLPDATLAEARQLLSLEFEKAMLAKLTPIAGSIGLEIVRLHIHGVYQDPVSGVALIKLLHELSAHPHVGGGLRFDLMRSTFSISEATTQWSGVVCTEEDLRALALQQDVLTQALVELATIRKDGISSKLVTEKLEESFGTCVAHGHMLGAFEIAYRLALTAQSRGHFARSERWYRVALDCAQKGSFLHGRISASLGLYNSLMSSSDSSKGNDATREIFNSLLEYATSEMGQATIGLNLVAIFQTQGNYARGGALAKELEIFFNDRGLIKLAGQAAFSDGACSAGIGEWKDAFHAWKRALGYDLQIGDEIGAAERRGAMAQAIAMDEFTKTRTISAEGMKQVRELLDAASKALASTDSGPEHIRTEAKLLQTYAQLSIIGQVPIEGLKHLQRAKNLYLALEMNRESALMDALSGLALLEVAKRGSPQMYEEAGHALQRALAFFSATEHTPIRWKIKYYLALSSYFHSQTKARDEDKAQWRSTAAEWLRDALADSELIRSAEVGNGSGLETDFSPGLGPEAMDPLKVVLGLTPNARLRTKKGSVGSSGRRKVSRQLH